MLRYILSRFMSEKIDLKELDKDIFRVVVFGSARLKPGNEYYDDIYRLGFEIGKMGADVITGGGPGIMEAANSGHFDGSKGNPEGKSIGIGIELPFEESMNKHLDIKEEHKYFSTRLDKFMQLSNIVVVAPGGAGTLLEFAYTWQLIQVGHINKMPIVCVGKMWNGLLKWVEETMLADGLISEGDTDYIHVVDTCDEAMSIVKKQKELLESNGGGFSGNLLCYGNGGSCLLPETDKGFK